MGRYVFPTILSNFCFVLFAIIDAIFVGRGVGTNALGAINLVNPFVLVVNALNLLISVGGVAICAVHMGKGDYERANVVFRHGILLLLCAAAVLSLAGTLFTDRICSLLGAGETFHQYAADYTACRKGLVSWQPLLSKFCMNLVLIERIGDLGSMRFQWSAT